MRRANGTGTIKKLSGARRRPWTIYGFAEDKDGKRTRQYFGYYETRADAEKALLEMNMGAHGLSGYTATIAEVREVWKAEHYRRIRPSTQQDYDVGWSHMQDIANWKLNDHPISEYQAWYDNLEIKEGLHYPQLRHVRVTLSLIYKYALKNDLARRNPAPLLVYPPLAKEWESREGKIITDAEQEALRDLISGEGAPALGARIYAILLYTGMRISELLGADKTCWHLDEEIPYISVLQSKTDAGVRDVPLHPDCMPYVRWFLDYTVPYRTDPSANQPVRDSGAVLVNLEGARLGYSSYSGTYWPYVRDALQAVSGVQHITHDTRHTLITQLEALAVPSATVRAIVGHKGPTVTERVYTHIPLKERYEALMRVQYHALSGTP